MEKPWAKPFKNREELRPLISSMGLQGHICWFLGVVFAVLGLIAGAMSTTIGLEPTHWLLLSIAAFVAGIPMWLTWAMARRILGIEPKKEE